LRSRRKAIADPSGDHRGLLSSGAGADAAAASIPAVKSVANVITSRSMPRLAPDYSTTPLSKKLGAKPGAEVTVFFTTSRAELERRFRALEQTLAPADGLWIAWPKKASKIETDLDFDAVQRIGLDAGLVDNKSAAIDADWQAVRFVHRLRDR
jgi:hypothetical protein